MVHDPELLDRLSAYPAEKFSGQAFRATRKNLDPLLASTSGGRWMPTAGASVLYTCFERDGAIAEIAFHWAQLTPRPTRGVVLHTLRVETARTLRLLRADLASLGVAPDVYSQTNCARTQEIGAAAEFLGCDGLIAPSARWDCNNLMIFPDILAPDAVLEVVASSDVDWLRWSAEHRFLN